MSIPRRTLPTSQPQMASNSDEIVPGAEVPVIPTTSPVADSELHHQVVIPPVSSEDRPPLLGRQAGDIELGLEDEEENEVLEEIDNILDIKGLPRTAENRCKEALESWSEKDKLFTSRIDSKRKRSSDVLNEIYQLIGYYSVFQGVLLTAAAQSNLLHCNNTWTVTLLSVLASFLCAIGILGKLRNLKELEDEIFNEGLTRRALITWQLNLREAGLRFDFKVAKARKWHVKHKLWLFSATVWVTFFLVIFSVTFVVSIRQIVCNPGHTLLPGSP